MAVKIKTQFGTIDITNDVIATVVGGAATDNYGVVGMASRNQYVMALTIFCVVRIIIKVLLFANKKMVFP